MTDARSGDRRFWIATIAAVALVTGLELALLRSLADRGSFAKYPYFADRVLAGDVPRARLGDLSPGYLALMVALRKLGLEPGSIVALQVAMSGAAALGAASVAHRIGGRPAAALAAAFVLASRTALVNAAELEPESAILLAESAALALVVGPRGSRRLFAAGLFSGAAVILRPVAVLPLAGLACFRSIKDGGGGLARAARAFPLALAAGAGIPVLGIAAWNRALTGSVLVMNPGTVFYEGMNPSASPCGEAEPRIVKDVEATLSEPDALHVAYEIVAARATGGPREPRATNRFWTSRSVAFAKAFPRRASWLVASRAAVLAGNHEVFDLATQRRKWIELERYPLVPFGTIFSCALAGAWLCRRRPPAIATLVDAVCLAAVPIAFYVIARQRNPLVTPLSVLGAAGIVEIARCLRDGRAALGAVGLAVAIAAMAATAIDGAAQREDRRSWDAAESALAEQRESERAAAAGDRVGAFTHAALSATWQTPDATLLPAGLLADAALSELARADEPERRFDLAVALLAASYWTDAELVLAGLEAGGYRPYRGSLTAGSVAYHHARALLHLGRSEEARAALARAEVEAPGDAGVLALREALGGEDAARQATALLAVLVDPFTADLARARAALDLGRRADAERILGALQGRIPEWKRPAMELDALREDRDGG